MQHNFEDEAPFFADMTLDLKEAHDFADTPEPPKRIVGRTTLGVQPNHGLQIPAFTHDGNNSSSNTSNNGSISSRMSESGAAMHPSSSQTEMISSLPAAPNVLSSGAPPPPPPPAIGNNAAANTSASIHSHHATNCSNMELSSGRNTRMEPMNLETGDQLLSGGADPDDSHTYTNINSGSNNNYKNDSNSNNSRKLTPSARRWPRDAPWAVAFCIIVPFCLLVPIITSPSIASASKAADKSDMEWIGTASAPRLATLHTLFWGYGATLILSRLLYRTMGGGDGDDARYIASQVLLASAPISVSVYLSLIGALYLMTRNAFHFAIIPLWYLARDLFLFRSWKRTSTTPGGRQAFFQALTCMTLDILSRSLRRSSFYRVVSSILFAQFAIIWLWRMAILGALRSNSTIMFLMAVIGGKWATGTVARLLSLIASGGIASWFAEQNTLVAELELTSKSGSDLQPLSFNNGHFGGHDDDDDDEEEVDFMNQTNTEQTRSAFPQWSSMPEAYSSVDASAYKSALVMDEGMDDDFDDEDERGNGNHGFSSASAAFANSAVLWNSLSFANNRANSTVKHLLFSGLTLSFGSVAQCGLLGGLAQFVWSQLRKIDAARATFRGFRGMAVAGVGSANGRIDPEEETVVSRFLRKANVLARAFVRFHSDMGMCHVASYQKSYQRAAQDVAVLVDESGVEPIIHDDISTHISSCVGGSASGVIVIFTGFVLVHQRNRLAPDISDAAVVLDMLLAFILCYTMIFTAMEPLRASIKAVYVSFAQHPQSLSQAYPLIFHRLSRMSESNLS